MTLKQALRANLLHMTLNVMLTTVGHHESNDDEFDEYSMCSSLQQILGILQV